MKKIILILVLTLPIIVNSQVVNIVIDNNSLGVNPNEPSIKISRNNTNHMVAGTNLNNYYISTDGGYNWTTGTMTSSFGVWGDPVIEVDSAGDFYFFHLSNPASGNWIDRIVCQKLTDINTSSWNDGSYTGLNGTKAQDKHWSVVDYNTNNIYITWTQFDDYGSSSPLDSSVILFSKTTDQGATWSTAKRINKYAGNCIDSDNTTEGAVPAIGTNAEIFVAWASSNGIVFNRSLDDGDTWLPQEISVSSQPGGWDYAVPGIYRANGLPVTVCDLSNGPNRGTIYVNWTDQRNGTDNTDVWLSKSTDSGDTWSIPVRVNDDTTNTHQFFSWMTIDQVTGYLYFVFYDRRNYTDTNTDVYLAISKDGGNTFTNAKISESPFVPSSGVFFGDYTNISAHNNVIRPIWTRLHQGNLTLLTAIVDSSTTNVKDNFNTNIISQSVQPNPFVDLIYHSFKLHKKSIVSLSVIDSEGKLITKILENKQLDYGKYVESFNAREFNLKNGTYYFVLDIDGKSQTKKIILNN